MDKAAEHNGGDCGEGMSTYERLLLDLLCIPSVTGDERAVALALEGFITQRFPDAQIDRQLVSADRWNVIVTKGNPEITLTTHIDTVPGGAPPVCTSERIFGRGACDAKGQVVAQLWGLDLAIQGGLRDFRCAFVVGEETDAAGAQKLLSLPTTPYLLNGEPTGNRFASRGWGCLELEINASGVSAHSSLSTHESAIHRLVQDLSVLLRDVPQEISLNVGTIRGGVASNVQAPFATCDICARMRDDAAVLFAHLAKHLVHSTWREKFPATPGLPFFVPSGYEDSSFEVRFASDCSVYVRRYDRIMLFGPGRIEDAHTDDESIGREELRAAAEILCSVILNPGHPGAEH